MKQSKFNKKKSNKKELVNLLKAIKSTCESIGIEMKVKSGNHVSHTTK